MFENHSTLEVQPGRLDEALSILKNEIVPLVKSSQGLLSLCLTPDWRASQVVVISLWDHQHSAEAVEHLEAYQRGARRLASISLPYSLEQLSWTLMDQLANHISYQN